MTVNDGSSDTGIHSAENRFHIIDIMITNVPRQPSSDITGVFARRSFDFPIDNLTTAGLTRLHVAAMAVASWVDIN